MKPLKQLTGVFLALALALGGLTGCAGRPTAAPAAQSALPQAAPGCAWVTDCAGRQVEIPQAPERVAALDSFAGEAMVMLGAGDKMVAAPNGVKSDRLLQAIDPALQEVGVPMSGGGINGEALLALSPDLILLKGAMYETGGEADQLDRLGIPYLVISYTNMEEQQKALALIGGALGGEAQEQAAAINRYYQSVVDRARAISEKIPQDERLRVYHAINEITRTDGTDSLGCDWITCAGAVDVSAGESKPIGGTDYFASAEQIFAWNPDRIICNEAGTARYLYQEPKWAGMEAVRDKRVYNIPVGATRWGQRGSLETVFAVLWLGTTIYPEYYADVDLKSEVRNFYKTYLGLTIDDYTYAGMLDGEGIRAESTGSGAGNTGGG